MIIVKSGADLDGMRVSGRIAAQVRDALVPRISPGVTTAELADYAAELMRACGAESAFYGYRGFPGQICVSVNEVVVHGIPGPQRIRLGDIVSLDVGVRHAGFIGDTATTVMVGVVDPAVIALVENTRRALAEGIANAVQGRRVGDVSHAIEAVAVGAGLGVVREFVGHGVGRTMHEDPQIPNFGRAGKGPLLKSGMTLAIEPMINLGSGEVEVQADGWTVVTKDRKPSAHFEHSVAVRNGQAEVLTL